MVDHRRLDTDRIGRGSLGPAIPERDVCERSQPQPDHPGDRSRHVYAVHERGARDGEERVMEPGDLFYVPPGHDSWVVGNEPYISLHVMGSENYAT